MFKTIFVYINNCYTNNMTYVQYELIQLRENCPTLCSTVFYINITIKNTYIISAICLAARLASNKIKPSLPLSFAINTNTASTPAWLSNI